MAGQIEIINIALARLGESPIQDINEGSAPANAAKLIYDAERQATLRSYPWNFALKQKTLARLDQEDVDFENVFALPVDCLRVVRLMDAGSKAEAQYVTRGGCVCTDSDRVILEYVADMKDATFYDSKFVEALTYRLASALAMPVKGSPELMGNYMNLFRDLVTEAAARSAGEERNVLSDNPYLEARM